jgi:hypothetical protein
MILYKYFAPNEYAFKSLAVRGLYCNFPIKMNDPFECLALIKRSFTDVELNTFRLYLHNFPSDPLAVSLYHLTNSQLIEAINAHRRKRIEKFAFCSLSEECDNILMWSHYARAHTGFVVGFEFPELENTHHLRQVRYLDKMDNFDLLKWGEAMIEQIAPMHSHLIDDISVKSKDWSYEKEWRLWRKFPCYYNFNADQIKSIFLGISCDQETKSIIASLTKYVNIDVNYYEMEFDAENIKLKW